MHDFKPWPLQGLHQPLVAASFSLALASFFPRQATLVLEICCGILEGVISLSSRGILSFPKLLLGLQGFLDIASQLASPHHLHHEFSCGYERTDKATVKTLIHFKHSTLGPWREYALQKLLQAVDLGLIAQSLPHCARMDKTIRPWLVAIDSLINYVSTLGSPFTPSTCPTLKREKKKKKTMP